MDITNHPFEKAKRSAVVRRRRAAENLENYFEFKEMPLQAAHQRNIYNETIIPKQKYVASRPIQP